MATTYAQLIYVDYQFFGYDFPLPHYEAYGARCSQDTFSEPVVFHQVSFSRENDTSVDRCPSFDVTRSGLVNSVRIATTVQFKPGVDVTGSSWLDPPLVLPLGDARVEAGDRTKV